MRPALFILSAIPALALGACAPGDDGKGERGPSGPPIGFELAAAAELEARDVLGQTGGDIAGGNPDVFEINVERLLERLAADEVRLIDVRRDDEVAQGMIPGAEHIAMDAFDPAMLDLSDGREVILYCRSGRRSAVVAEKLAAFTGEPAIHLSGGILAWQAFGETVE